MHKYLQGNLLYQHLEKLSIAFDEEQYPIKLACEVSMDPCQLLVYKHLLSRLDVWRDISLSDLQGISAKVTLISRVSCVL